MVSNVHQQDDFVCLTICRILCAMKYWRSIPFSNTVRNVLALVSAASNFRGVKGSNTDRRKMRCDHYRQTIHQMDGGDVR